MPFGSAHHFRLGLSEAIVPTTETGNEAGFAIPPADHPKPNGTNAMHAIWRRKLG